MTANPDFSVQRVQGAPDHWCIVCRHCSLTWYLPKDERKRTASASAILREHAAEHAAGKPIASKPLPFTDASGEPTDNPEQNFWSRRACQRLRTEDPLAVKPPPPKPPKPPPPPPAA